jgi:hypothetical protein
MKAQPVFYVITQEHLNRLAEAAVLSANPPTHLACDWLDDPMGLGLVVYPPRVYEKIKELKHGRNSSS